MTWQLMLCNMRAAALNTTLQLLEREGNNLSVMENYAKNGRENNKFIENSVNMKRQR